MPSKRKRNRRKRRPQPSHQRKSVTPHEDGQSSIRTPKAPRSNSLVHEVVYTTTPRKQSELNALKLSSLFNDDERLPLMNNGTPDFKRESASSHSLLRRSRSFKEVQTCKDRSLSSMAKLHSPGLEKIPLTIDVSTQTVYYNHSLEKSEMSPDRSVHLHDFINIFETPKLELLDVCSGNFQFSPVSRNATLNKITDLNMLGRSEPIKKVFNCSKKIRSSSLRRLQNFNEVLLTCTQENFVPPKIIQNDLKNNLSESEISFFSPQLFQLESASTPIEYMQKNEKLYKPKRETQNKFEHTPKIKDTNTRCNSKMWKPRSCVNRRMYKSISPKSLHKMAGEDMKSGKCSGKDVPKTFSPVRRTSMDRSENFFNVSKVNAYGRFMARVKKFHTRYSAKWTEKVVNICSWLGLTLKKSLSSLCARAVPTLSIEESKAAVSSPSKNQAGLCKCNDYETQLNELNSKLVSLQQELTHVTNANEKKIDNLMQEMDRMRQELLQVESALRRIELIEECLKTRSLASASSPSIPPPPPPPPPPPLPPPPPITTAIQPMIKTISQQERDKSKTNENSRPVISLEDILKVKLRKTIDKPVLSKRATHPVISMEILSQVKLRPASSRAHTPTIPASSSSSPASSSPATSLTKLLCNVDTTVRRVKRLRRYSGYNLDDSRRRRERNETDDT